MSESINSYTSGSEADKHTGIRIGSRNKCKSAAVLLGLAKTQSKQTVKRKYRNSSVCLNRKAAKTEASVLSTYCSENKSSADLSSVDVKLNTKTEWLKPFDNGWCREVVHRGTSKSTSKPYADVYYFTPDKLKLRSMPEVIDYLKCTKSQLTADCFTFIREPIFHEPHEVVRLAGVARGRQFASTVNESSSLSNFTNNTMTDNPVLALTNAVQQTSSSISDASLDTVCESDFPLSSSAGISPLKFSTVSQKKTYDNTKKLAVKLNSRKSKLSKKYIGSYTAILSRSLGSAAPLSQRCTVTVKNKSAAVASEVSALVKHIVNKESKKSTSCIIGINTKEKRNETACNSVNNVIISVPSDSLKLHPALTITRSTVVSTQIANVTCTDSSLTMAMVENSFCSQKVSVATKLLSKCAAPAVSMAKSASKKPLSYSKPLSIPMSRVNNEQPSASDRSVSSKSSITVFTNSSADATRKEARNDTLEENSTKISSALFNGNVSVELRQCGLDCSGRFGVPPSLQCGMCMYIFHPECVSFSYLAHKTGFICKSCQLLRRELTMIKYTLNNQSTFSFYEHVSDAVHETPTIKDNTCVKLVAEELTNVIDAHSSSTAVVCKSSCKTMSEKSSIAVSCKTNNSTLNALTDTSKLKISTLGNMPALLGFSNQDKFASTDRNSISLNSESMDQTLILPIAVQYLLDMCLPIELCIENKRVLLTPTSYRMTAAEFIITLPSNTLTRDYLSDSKKSLLCQVRPASSSCSQRLKIGLVMEAMHDHV